MRKHLVLLLLTISSFCQAESREHLFGLTPELGVYGAMFVGDKVLMGAGPLVAAAVDYRLTDNFAIGAKGGGYVYWSETSHVAPLFAFSAEFALSRYISIGLEFPVLPGLFVRFNEHRFSASVLPIYFPSGGSTLVALSYGYRFGF